MNYLKKTQFSISKVVAGILFGALCLSVTSPMPAATAIADQTVSCSGGGTFSIVSNVVTTSTLTCAGAVIIPNGVTSIAASAFSRLSKTSTEQARITSVSIPNSVTSIGESAFRDCRNASSLTIGTAVTTIGNDAFNNFIGLTSLIIPSSVTSIGDRAFANVNLTSLTLNEGLLTVGDSAFLGHKLVTLVIPNSVTTISTEAAFAGWGLIESLTLGSGLTTIGNRTFEGVGRLQSLTIPRGVTTLGTNAFRDYPQATYTYCGTSLTLATLNSAGLTGKTNTLACPQAQSITRTSTSPTSPVKSGTYTPTATASSSLTVAISIAAGSSSVCSISGGVVTFNAAGSCVIQYDQAGSSTYYAATQVTETLTIGKATPTFSIWNGISKNYGESPFTVTAPSVTGSVAGNFSYSSETTSVISVSGSTFTVAGVGTSVITATFTPTDSANYNTATTTMTVTVGSGSQTITRTSTSPTSPVKSESYTPTATASSSLTVAISIAAGSSSVCSISGGIVTFNTVGSCVIQYNQSGNSNYLAATQVTETLLIGKEVPTFTWTGVSKVYGESFSLNAPISSTPGTFTYFSASTSVISLNGATAMATGFGTSLITATFTPSDTTNFVSGGTATMTISVDKATITVTPTAGQSKVYGENNPNITYSVSSGALIGSDVLSGALTYTGSNVGLYPISIGTLGNSNYTITLDAVNFAITKAAQAAVTLSSLSAAYNPSNKTVSLTGSGGTGTGNYQYALDASNTTPGCSVSGSTLTYTTAGTCVVAVTRSLDTNYLARTDVVSFSIGLASQTITFGSLSAKNYSAETFTVSATSSASLTVVFTSVSQSVCTTSGTSGSIITLLGVGTCVINANQIGDSNIAAASQVSQNFTVNPRPITVTADAKTKVFGAADPTFTYTITTGSLVLGDEITGALTRVTGADVGDYQIQQGTLTTVNNPKYAITFVSADLSITRATPALVLTYPNSNVAILRPGAADTPTVTTSSSSGALTFATTAASSICTVDTTTGVISLVGAGSCPVAMTTAITTNFIQFTETTTVTVALLSTSLVGIDQSDLVSMGQPFFAHASVDQAYSFSSGSNGASVAIPAGALDPLVPISIHLLTDSADQRTLIGGTGTSVLSVVVSWVAPDGSVPDTNSGKAISVTLTNPAIRSGAKIYSIIGNQSRLLGTATVDGSITTQITEDPVLMVINPVVVTAPSFVSSPATVDNSAVFAAAKELADKKAAEEAAAAALKAAQEKMAADAKALAEAKAAQDAAALKAAQDAADASVKEAAVLQAARDAAIAAANAAKAIKPDVTLYSLSSTLKLNPYDSAYLNKYVKSLKNGASVTCIGYTYGKSPASKASQALAKRQATAVCAQMKTVNKSLKTSIVIYPATKAPKAAVGAKWVGVSYRIDGFRPKP